MKPATCFPLSWPPGHARTADRKRSHFGADHAGAVSLPAARQSVIDELTKLGATAIIVTTNVPTTRAEARGLAGAYDPGVAAFFTLDGAERVIACDRWTTIAENLRAVGLTVEATRALARWGASDVVARAMAGFAALPAPASGWQALLGPCRELAQARRSYRALIAKAHPDRGGTAATAAALNAAMEAAERDLAGAV